MSKNTKKAAQYKLNNWSAYNRGLKERGTITLYIHEDVAKQWYMPEAEKKKRGVQQVYSDYAIQTCLEIKAHFGLAYRQLEGFVNSLFAGGGLAIKCPEFSRLSRRGRSLEIDISPTVKGPLCLAIDGTGLKIVGEGEWKVRMHGKDKRRQWRKAHPVIDLASKQTVAIVMTDQHTTDDAVLEELLEQVEGDIESVHADGAYDKAHCYEAIHARGALPVIPPRIDATLQSPGNIIHHDYNPALKPRDEAILAIDQYKHQGLSPQQARKQWQHDVGYYQRSNVETHMCRHKTIFGHRLASKKYENQCVELKIQTKLLNRFSSYAMPDSFKNVAA